MSSGESFLARWARRKQAVKEEERPVEEAGPREPITPQTPKTAIASPGEEPSPEAIAEAEPLPSPDELTAESDITAFLGKNVPAALKQAALRRVWALDPAIRDYVSPAEYAWDFNEPNSIPGFSSTVGSMDLAGFFSGEAAREPLIAPRAEPVAAQGPPASVQPPPLSDESVVAGRADLAANADESPGEAPPAPPSLRQEAPEEPDIAPRRHGGALPR